MRTHASPPQQPPPGEAPQPLPPAWQRLEAHLRERRQAIFASIRDYPPPITGCDAQFNHLLEQRDGIAAELARLEALRAAGRLDAAALAEFLAASAFVDAAAARDIRAVVEP